ncbi:MAG: nitroreductase family protein [Candidatus Thermoplasmatota archaeon]|nr:nitroreductase family protein [Candidatus Thermoplasmatota archaeon]
MSVRDVINERRAYRALDPVDITRDTIEELMEAVSLTPSCFNNQPWRFIFSRDSIEEVKEALSSGNAWAKSSSLIVAVTSRKEDDCIIKDREYHHFDVGMAAYALILRATELGLVAHPIAGYDPEIVREKLGIPDEFSIITLIIIGKHSNDTSLLSEKQAETEKRRPERKPFSDLFFIDGWGI